MSVDKIEKMEIFYVVTATQLRLLGLEGLDGGRKRTSVVWSGSPLGVVGS